jgi:hypothetical protein
MGVTLDLRLIDHERIVVRGLEAVNLAIRKNDPEILRSYLAALPIDVDPAEVEHRLNRLARLREFSAPQMIIENEERLLRFANGEAYQPDEYRNATLDELRQLLGTWCWASHSFSLDKSWNELHWFLAPLAGPDEFPLDPVRPKAGDPTQSIFDKAICGAQHYPVDALGAPIVRTLGSLEPDCSGYNPPATAAEIWTALQKVEPDSWTNLIPFRSALYLRESPDMDGDEIADGVANELDFARDAFPILLNAYARAAEKGFGVSCEYSL